MNRINYLSLGAGVQSSTLALMFSDGPVAGHPVPDCAIFADTGAEPAPVYEWLDWLETQLPYPVHRVQQAEGLERNILAAVDGARFAGAPFYTTSDTKRGAGMLRRQCTRDFKIDPITRKVRELLGVAKHKKATRVGHAIGYIGISMDEIQRVKDSRVKWITHAWPLLDLKMTRQDCEDWLRERTDRVPAKSSCYFCPYHSNQEWRWLRDNAPEDLQRAIELDAAIRDGVRGTTQKLYLHGSMIPLADLIDMDFEPPAPVEPWDGQYSLWDMECEGMCGL